MNLVNPVNPVNMKSRKRKKLEKTGWKVGSAEEFLELSEEETTFVELKLTLSENLRKGRIKNRLSQSELAKRLSSSQSRVAKMEASDPTVSVDLLIRALFAAGAKKKDIANAIAKSESLAA
jgi:ribosome-binding protein aMBF1 (putative translation factor)